MDRVSSDPILFFKNWIDIFQTIQIYILDSAWPIQKKRSPKRTKIGLNEEVNRGESGRRFGAAEQEVISRRQSLNSRDEQTQTFRLPRPHEKIKQK